MKHTIYKYTLIIAVILTVLVFSGCIKASITGEVTSNYTAVYKGDVTLDLSKSEYTQQALAQQSLLKLSDYWKKAGYESEVTLDNEKYHVNFKKQQSCTSYQEAYDSLFELMTDNYSPLKSLTYQYTSYENYSDYTISGNIDIQDALDNEVLNAMQENVKQLIMQELSNLDAKVIFILPNHENIEQANDSFKTFSFNVKSNEVTEFNFNGRVYSDKFIKENIEKIEKSNYYNNLKYILLGIFVILLIVTILIIIKLNRK